MKNKVNFLINAETKMISFRDASYHAGINGEWTRIKDKKKFGQEAIPAFEGKTGISPKKLERALLRHQAQLIKRHAKKCESHFILKENGDRICYACGTAIRKI